MLKNITLIFLFTSCSPTYRLVQHVRGVPKPETCPTTTMLLADFVLSGVGLAMAATKYIDRDYPAMAGYFGAGMTVGLAANLAETTCR